MDFTKLKPESAGLEKTEYVLDLKVKDFKTILEMKENFLKTANNYNGENLIFDCSEKFYVMFDGDDNLFFFKKGV